MSTERQIDIVERCKRTAAAMRRTAPDSGIDICHITAMDEAAATITALRSQVAALTAERDTWKKVAENAHQMMVEARRALAIEKEPLALIKPGAGEANR